MQSLLPLWIALTTGFFVLAGALGSQVINTRANAKLKKLEMLYVQKARAYTDFVVKAGTFAHDPWKEAAYVEFLHAYLSTLVVSSNEVHHALSSKDGVHEYAQQLRSKRDFQEMSIVQGGPWWHSMEIARESMRKDLQSLSET